MHYALSIINRGISDLGWRQFRTFLEGKAEKYGRDFRVISRWEPTSQTCSCCGFKGGKLDLSILEWECLNCGAKHDRNGNAAINILVAGGQSETKNGRGGKCNPPPSPPWRGARGLGPPACETSTHQGSSRSVGTPLPLGRGRCQNQQYS